jgi:hypothetical protein
LLLRPNPARTCAFQLRRQITRMLGAECRGAQAQQLINSTVTSWLHARLLCQVGRVTDGACVVLLLRVPVTGLRRVDDWPCRWVWQLDRLPALSIARSLAVDVHHINF